LVTASARGGHSFPGRPVLLVGVGAAIDVAGGSFTMGYTTVVATAARTGGPGTS
jgi:hypothetical protein